MLDDRLSPIVAAALAQRQGERAEDALCAEAVRVTEDAHVVDVALRDLPDGALLARRAAGVAAGEEFAITRELRRRRLEQIFHGSDLKTLKKAERAHARGEGLTMDMGGVSTTHNGVANGDHSPASRPVASGL